MQNTFVTFLDLLGVKHTKSYANQYFNEHPHKYNLFGLSKMLLDYGIDNVATRIPDKENNISEIETPFIAQFSGDFVGVYQINSSNVTFIWRGINHVLPIAKFVEAWTGIVLLAGSSEKSIEPDYNKHRKTDLMNLLKKTAFFSSCGLIALFAYIRHVYYINVGISILLILNAIGLYISWLLLQKQMHVENQYADKICSLFKQKDCNNVLESDSAKLFGMFSWSEIGFGYFLTNFILLLLSPAFFATIALFNVFTLPFTAWSIWFQRFKAKQWCMLCLSVVVLLWAIFIIDCFGCFIQIPAFSNRENDFQFSIFIIQFFVVGVCYLALVLGTNLLGTKLINDISIPSLRQSLNSLKSDEDVFTTLLKKQPFYETNDLNSVFHFGNPESKLKLTVLSNPYCNPCAKLHKRIEELMQQVNNEVSVQYMLSSFRENLNSTNRYLIAACLKNEPGVIIQILSDWFEKGKALKDDYFKGFDLNLDNPAIEVEFRKHESWRKKSQIRGTPTVLVNGYKMPENYTVEDLRYFTNLDLWS